MTGRIIQAGSRFGKSYPRLVPAVIRAQRLAAEHRTRQLESIVFASVPPGRNALDAELVHHPENLMNFQDAVHRMAQGAPESFRARRKVWEPKYYVHLNGDGAPTLVNAESSGTRAFGNNWPNLTEDAADSVEHDWVVYDRAEDEKVRAAATPAVGRTLPPPLESESFTARVEEAALTVLAGLAATGTSLGPAQIVEYAFRLAVAFVREADLRRDADSDQ